MQPVILVNLLKHPFEGFELGNYDYFVYAYDEDACDLYGKCWKVFAHSSIDDGPNNEIAIFKSESELLFQSALRGVIPTRIDLGFDWKLMPQANEMNSDR